MSELRIPNLPRWVKYLLIPGFVGPALILVFILATGLAHDEKRCPYVEQESRQVVDGVWVREDRRSCLSGVEERRFSVVRGNTQRVLGRRRFSTEAFDAKGYHWVASMRSPQEVQVIVHNPGHEDALFREGTPAERAM